ncbi:ABC transporter permease [Nocardia sp. 852002-20019_SCH5090214]|jgi:phospholipid/cholesterol/gamma-HCH transport system permease protein|uniref:ABC transporter permease n=2 Tax=Nocardia TaxID=1817 RepID=A0A2S5ZWG0_9NOCA|nr:MULTISPECIES: ABC transporter permease [Nocardia]OBF68472.1 ABC transporter permease [Mycobacterium sp. 852002-51759_SCH5129042]MBF6278380.1 ABC transporter permease [Nocardia nova]MDN2495334.1 ABC transporter permease [Nocardia nova]OBA41025.1 ABC transporter permease [Nocardia sp. 852002-51101_SCH5132738]OBA50111.1 ABC transporter permease [Nocardia sp. 852002-20019_SCH5090214]
MFELKFTPPRVVRIRRSAVRLARILPIEAVGFVIGFAWQALSAIPFTLKRYRAETMRTITDITWGQGSIIVGGGTVPMLVVLGLVIGGSVGVESFSTLDLISMGPVTGIVSAFANTRELAPIAAGVGFAAQAGCRITAQIGSMRISEEIDALESLGLRSIPFVVTTRIIAGAVAIVPTFLIALLLSYVACRTVIVQLHGQAAGVYDHYFYQFISGWDMTAAVIKVLVFGTAVILIHSYQGFFAVGGPEGVGIASGRAVRASFVAIIGLDMVLTILLWGINSSIEFTG